MICYDPKPWESIELFYRWEPHMKTLCFIHILAALIVRWRSVGLTQREFAVPLQRLPAPKQLEHGHGIRKFGYAGLRKPRLPREYSSSTALPLYVLLQYPALNLLSLLSGQMSSLPTEYITLHVDYLPLRCNAVTVWAYLSIGVVSDVI